MKVDEVRVSKDLRDIRERSRKIEEIFEKYPEDELFSSDVVRLALKYLVIEIAEAMANILQHMLARHFGVAVKGYIDTVNKAFEKNIITESTFRKLKPFFDFRNSLIHRYWTIDDRTFINNLRTGYSDFFSFSEEIERFVTDSAHD